MSRAALTGRIMCAAVTFGLPYIRHEFFAPANNLGSVAIAHCLSALCNAAAIAAAYIFLSGAASYCLQRLAFCAIVVNLAGLLAYAAKSSPLVFVSNESITVISYAQLICILWPTNGSIINLGWLRSVFGWTGFQSKGIHMEAEK